LVLHLNQADRGFWATNAPAFDRFCAWLRTQQAYGTNTVSRAQLMELNVQDLKLSYKAAKTAGNSNALYLAWAVLNQAWSQSTSWSNIITAPVHP
jgi:hypothetical protein